MTHTSLDSAYAALFSRGVQQLLQIALPLRREYASWPMDHVYNGWFESGDLELYYAMIRSLQPSRIIEIGSGFATAIAADACRKNGRGSIVCVDPEPRTDLPGDVQFHRARVEDVDLTLFDSLESGDLLFIDSSHSEEKALYHRTILDRLVPGVTVHHHDFMYPNPPRFPEERVIIEYYTSRSQDWEGLISNAMARHKLGAEQYAIIFPHYARDPIRYPGSVYLRKRPQALT